MKDVEFEKSRITFQSKRNGHEKARQSQKPMSIFSGAVIQGGQSAA